METSMTHELHCSACDAIVPQGSQRCPGCGLQLMAQAAPAVYVEGPRYSFWAVIVGAIGILLIVIYASSAHDAAKAADARSAFVADLAAGRISTPEVFEARCGMPQWMKQTARGTELQYRNGGRDIFATFTSTAGTLLEDEHVTVDSYRPVRTHAWRSAADPAVVYDSLHCK